MVVSGYLLKKFPDHTAGELTRLKAELVNETTLAKCAKKLKLGRFMRLGKGKIKTGGRRRPSILAGVFGAIIGAIYLDGGLKETGKFICSILE